MLISVITLFLCISPRLTCSNYNRGLKNTKDLNKYCKIKQINYCINDFVDNIFDFNRYFNFKCIDNNDTNDYSILYKNNKFIGFPSYSHFEKM